MRKTGLLKKALVIAMCAMLSVPAAGLAAEPMVVKAAYLPDNVIKDAANDLDDYFVNKKSEIPKDKIEEVKKIIEDAKKTIEAEIKTEAGAKDQVAAAKEKINGLIADSQEEAGTDAPADTTPTSTNTNIMVGGSWVTPTAKAGNHVSVVLPVVNMGRTGVKHVVVTPQISSDSTKWPFEIETSNYTQTIDYCPGTDDGGTDMDRRRELTWVLKTRKDAPSGYMPLVFDVTYEMEDKSLETVQLTTYVNVVGTTGKSADGTSSTPRVIVTGFSTNPEVVHAGDTFTLTLHMQNTSRATAVKNMLFDIQAASESTESNYVAASFLPTAGSSTIFVEQIAAGASKDISIELEARSDLAQKPYVVNVSMDYEDENVTAYKNTASVSIPVRQEARIDVSSIDVMPESIDVGGETNVMFSIYNIGKTQLYNTSVKFVADSVSGGDVFLGNIAPGASGSVDSYLTGAAATMDDGTVTIAITFEDESGETTTIEKTMTLWVNEPYYGDDMMGDMMDEDMMMEEQGGFKIWYVIVPLILVLVAVSVWVVLRKKKKKAQELLALDEDLLDAEESDDKEKEE